MNKNKKMGFTLLEMLLVMAIMGGMLALILNYSTRQAAQQRRDKTALQMQQILNAALAYYVDYGRWPVPSGTCSFISNGTNSINPFSTLSTLTSAGYLPSAVSRNTFGYSYNVACDSVTGSVFYVNTRLNNNANALVIAGEMPVGYVSDSNGNNSSNNSYVTAQVTTPGQNLNNARSVNFAGIYKNGACVPVPSCPGYNLATKQCNSGSNCMEPQIMVAPASVTGVSDTGSNYAYPITSFTAFATAFGSSSSGVNTCLAAAAGNTSLTSCSLGAQGVASPTGYYWRVCLQVRTGKGIVSTTNSDWGGSTALVVMTRCAPKNEPIGSAFTVYTQ